MAFECTLTLSNNQRVIYTALNLSEYGADIVLDQLTAKLIDRLNILAGLDRCERPDLELLGELLYRVLLPTGDGSAQNENLRKQLENDYAFYLRHRAADDRFRVTLELHKDAGKLARLPWEFLFMPFGEEGFFLAGEKTDLILTRFVPSQPPETNVKTEEPLRILVAFSHPEELGDIKSKVTEDVINDIEKLKELGHIEVRVEDNPTHSKLRELMNGKDIPGDDDKEPQDRERFRPDIFHFIGHGEPNKLALIRDEKSILEDEDKFGVRNEAAWCDSGEVLRLFSNHTPRLVFLHSCDSAKAASVESLSDLARDLVYAKIPVVIAMQHSINNKDAALFAKTFYGEIRNNSEIDEAVRAGREALGQRQGNKDSWSDRRFGTPVVYLQKNSQRAIVNFPKSNDSSYDPNAIAECPNLECRKPVRLSFTKCQYCHHDITMCPECRKAKNEWNLMDKATACGFCGYVQVDMQVTGGTSPGRVVTERAEQASPTAPEAPQKITPSTWGQPAQAASIAPLDRGLSGT